jgi:hypothetical protein
MSAIQLSRGKQTIVSDEDIEYLNQWKWSVHADNHGGIYAWRHPRVSGKRVAVRMHNVVVERMTGKPIPEGCQVDHIDGNTLNNRRGNLRLVTPSQNCMNRRGKRGTSSSFKGVSWREDSRKWRAVITVDGKRKSLGSYDSEEEAARAYDSHAKELFGEFARLNFSD